MRIVLRPLRIKELLIVHSHLSFIFLFALGVDSIIGLGIFTLPGLIFSKVGLYSPVITVICGILLSIVTFCMARLARFTTRNGGSYAYAHKILGAKYAFPLGILEWVTNAAGIGIFSVVLSQMLAAQLKLSANAAAYLGIGYVLFLTLINLMGIRPGGFSVLILTVLKVIPLVGIILYGTIHYGFTLPGELPKGIPSSDFSSAILMTLFLFQGFEMIPVIAQHTERTLKNVPLAMILSLCFCLFIYAGVYWVLAFQGSVDLRDPLTGLVSSLMGPAASKVIGLGFLFSLMGLMAARTLVTPRFLTAMAEDGFLSKIFTQNNKKFGTPTYSILLTGAIAVPFAFTREWTHFIELSALGVASQYFISCLCLLFFSFRKKTWDSVLAIFGILISLVFLFQVPLRAWLYMGGLLIPCLFISWAVQLYKIRLMPLKSMLP